MAKRFIKPAPRIRFLGEHQLIPNRFEWAEPSNRGQVVPSLVYTDEGAPYIPVKF